MRLAGLLLVVGIIGFFWCRRASTVGSNSKIDEELLATPSARPAQVSPGTTPAQPVSSGLRRPIDRTRNVLDQVKKRNGDGEF
jgi:hypothetical protein